MRSTTLLLRVTLLLWVWMVACADTSPEAPDELAQLEAQLEELARADADADADSLKAVPTVPYARAMDACYARSRSQAEVHAVGQYLALGDTMLAVRVSIPEAPRLARCIEDAVADDVPPGPPGADNQFASGSFAIDLGGAPEPLRPGDIERHFAAHQAGLRAMIREVVARGVLPADHFFVREVLETP